MNAEQIKNEGASVTPSLDSYALYHLFFYLTKCYTSFHVDCDHSARTFSSWHDVADFLSYCESHEYGKVMHNSLEFYRWGFWPELELAA